VAAKRVTLNFGNLPLVEAAVRVTFQPPIHLSYKSIVAIHDRVKEEFPGLAEPTQIEVAPGIGPSPDQFGPNQLPGVVFEGARSGLRVSLHPQVIVARWVKRFLGSTPEYPRYDALRRALWLTIEAVRETSRDAFSAILVTNMSYVNFVQVDNQATVLLDYFSSLAQVAATEEATQIRKVEAAWAEQDIDLRFSLEQVTARITGEPTEGYRLTTAGGRRLSEGMDAKSALDSVHERLQVFFHNLLSERARQEWELSEVKDA
jgi:uncharacterized protein (TIGR04255 family)